MSLSIASSVVVTVMKACWTGSGTANFLNMPGKVLGSVSPIFQDIAMQNITSSTLGNVASFAWYSFSLQRACSNIYNLNQSGIILIGALAGHVFGTPGSIAGAIITSLSILSIETVIVSNISEAMKSLHIC